MSAPEVATALPLAPHVFVRGLTAGLALFWTLRGAVRVVRGVLELDRLCARYGLPRGVVRRTACWVLLRATVLDPVNLGLMVTIALVFLLGGRL